MKTMKTIIASIVMLILFNISGIAGDKSFEKSMEVETWMTEPFTVSPETHFIYVNDIFDYVLISNIIDKFKKLFPSEFKDIEIIIEFGEKSMEQQVEFEDWMLEPFPIKEDPIVLEDWMTEPFKIK